MSDVLNGLEVFVAAVKTGSFAAAAEHLHLTRSAVAKTIARIEARLSVRLFHRTTRSLALTEDGQTYFESCVRALAALREAEAALDSGRREATGLLRVTAPVLFGRSCVAPVLARLAAQHPRLELDLSLSDRTVDLIADGFDLAIRSGETGPGAGLMTRVVSLQRMTVCASPDYLARHGTPQSLHDLRAHQAITYGHTGRIRPWLFPGEAGPMQEFTPPSRLRFDDLEAIADAAEAGHGLAWLPCWLVKEPIQCQRLVPLLAHEPRLIITIRALWPEAPHRPLRVRLAINALAEALPGSAELDQIRP